MQPFFKAGIKVQLYCRLIRLNISLFSILNNKQVAKITEIRKKAKVRTCHKIDLHCFIMISDSKTKSKERKKDKNLIFIESKFFNTVKQKVIILSHKKKDIKMQNLYKKKIKLCFSFFPKKKKRQKCLLKIDFQQF